MGMNGERCFCSWVMYQVMGTGVNPRFLSAGLINMLLLELSSLIIVEKARFGVGESGVVRMICSAVFCRSSISGVVESTLLPDGR